MKAPPKQLDNADVLCFVVLSLSHYIAPALSIISGIEPRPLQARPSRRSRQKIRHYLADGEPLGDVPALALCRYAGSQEVYLFYCDVNWTVVQDDLLENLEEALEQASAQYPGLARTDWQWYLMVDTPPAE